MGLGRGVVDDTRGCAAPRGLAPPPQRVPSPRVADRPFGFAARARTPPRLRRAGDPLLVEAGVVVTGGASGPGRRDGLGAGGG